MSGPAAIPFVGLTGAMGAGKSSALDALARLGAATLSTDRVVHDLYERPDVIGAVVERRRFADEGVVRPGFDGGDVVVPQMTSRERR